MNQFAFISYNSFGILIAYYRKSEFTQIMILRTRIKSMQICNRMLHNCSIIELRKKAKVFSYYSHEK